uniref:Ribonuclease H-like domain containing protein n=1 Tax=Tanacetum cinerariifolium TaxID=118510 RepID=A0A6L2NBH2_TANCI|nr:ribonuclease H-like domain containing protein [Tanacetum cinerariifolium]
MLHATLSSSSSAMRTFTLVISLSSEDTSSSSHSCASVTRPLFFTIDDLDDIPELMKTSLALTLLYFALKYLLGLSSGKNDKKSKRKAEYLVPKDEIMKQKFQGNYYNCDQPGHRAANYKMPKQATPRQATMVNDNVDMISMVSNIIAMIFEVNLSDKFVLSKNQMYVGKGYAMSGDSGLARTLIDTSTRPDLAYDVSSIIRYISNPSDAYWKAMTRDSKLTGGYMFTLGGAAISWKSSRKTIIAKSMMESEFITLDKCREKVEWLHQFIEDIPRWPKPVTEISIHCDSHSAIGRAHSIMYNGKSKHIRR